MFTSHCLYGEENPGPAIFDIIDSTTTVSADSSQGNEALFAENAGKQCVFDFE